MANRLRVLCVANKRLPPTDYRMAYGRSSSQADVIYALPDRPEGVAEDNFVRMRMGEGLSWWDAVAFVRLYSYLRRHRQEIDVVHFFSTKLQLFGPLCAALGGCPSVITVTGLGRTFHRDGFIFRALRPVYLALMWVSLKFARAVFFQNHGNMRQIREKLPQLAHKTHWIGSGIDAEVVETKDFAARPIRVLFVGRLMEDKGVRLLLEAARQLPSGFEFTLVGPASHGEEDLHKEVVRAAEQGQVQYLGELSSQQVAEEYRTHHIFAFPSTYGEGMPRVMLEAGHALLFPLASNIAAHRDLITDGSGVLLSVDNQLQSLLGNLRRLEADRAALSENAKAYQQRVIHDYSVAAYTRRLDNHLTRLLKPKSATADALTPELISVRFATIRDLGEIVAVHQQAFNGFFMTRLGSAFLRAYYRCVLDDPTGIVLVAESSDGKVHGFVSGFSDPPGFYTRFRARRIRLFLSAIPGLLRSPRLLGRLFGKSRRLSDACCGGSGRTGCELSSIAIEPTAQGLGLGRQLVTAFMDASRQHGALSVGLSTDADDNPRVNRFYQSLGFRVVATTCDAEDRRMHNYEISLPPLETQRAA